MSLECQNEVLQEKEIDKDIELDKDKEEEMNEPPQFTTYGIYQNIYLTDDEYKILNDKLHDHMQIMIDKLSRYIKSSGKNYQNHYATILSWHEQDKEKLIMKNGNKVHSSDYEDSISL